MDLKLSRRSFLGGAAAAGSSALLSNNAPAQAKTSARAPKADTATANLTGPPSPR